MRQRQEKAICINKVALRQRGTSSLLEVENEDSVLEYRYRYFSNSKLPLQIGMPVLTIDWDPQRGYYFSYSGTLRHFDSTKYDSEENKREFQEYFKEGDDIPSKRIFHDLTLDLKRLVGKEEEDYTINSFKYSIPFVTDFQRPIKHFGPLRLIDFEDYTNIINNTIFISRTTFGELINSLPIENRIELTMQLRAIQHSDYPYIQNYDVALGVVFNFIQTGLYSKGQLLVNAFELAQELKIDGFNPRELIHYPNSVRH